MNKTVDLNIGGLFFRIEEPAYFLLKDYLKKVTYSLKCSQEEQEEILADVEFRIAELLSEHIKNERQVVVAAYIRHIIEQMGRPEDYDDHDEEKEASYHDADTSSSETDKTQKKLYRDLDRSALGGVSGGLSYYLNISVIWVRLMWHLFTKLVGLALVLGGLGALVGICFFLYEMVLEKVNGYHWPVIGDLSDPYSYLVMLFFVFVLGIIPIALMFLGTTIVSKPFKKSWRNYATVMFISVWFVALVVLLCSFVMRLGIPFSSIFIK